MKVRPISKLVTVAVVRREQMIRRRWYLSCLAGVLLGTALCLISQLFLG